MWQSWKLNCILIIYLFSVAFYSSWILYSRQKHYKEGWTLTKPISNPRQVDNVDDGTTFDWTSISVGWRWIDRQQKEKKSSVTKRQKLCIEARSKAYKRFWASVLKCQPRSLRLIQPEATGTKWYFTILGSNSRNDQKATENFQGPP